jgi:hypothetical protein
MAAAVVLLLAALLLAIFLLLLDCDASESHVDGGADACLVVDTLNLCHWLGGRIDVVRAIDKTAPLLQRYNVFFVVKDRTKTPRIDYERLRAAAVRNRVTIVVAEPQDPRPDTSGAALGRDDFFMAVLAHRLRCRVATEDRMRNLEEMRGSVAPFFVRQFTFWRDAEERDFVRPDAPAFRGLPRPRRVSFATLGLKKTRSE